MSMANGRFITFEGGDATGKTTQVRRLAGRLRSLGHEVVETREPGGSPGAEAIRHVLLSGFGKQLGTDAEALFFAAARDDHLTTLIRPALERGAWVICDRFIDSTRVYQGLIGKVDPHIINGLERIIVGATRPDLTFILDVPIEVGLARVRERSEEPNRFETKDLENQTFIREMFQRIANNEPQRCVLIDASTSLSPDALAVRIWMMVSERLLRSRQPAAAPRARA
jgi:dTMP kinase